MRQRASPVLLGVPLALQAIVVALACASCPGTVAAQHGLGPSEVVGIVIDADLAEISGLAGSRTHRDILWAVNDSGNAERLFALSNRGRKLAAFDVEGVINVDWEDLASFDYKGRHYLLIADTGDNGGVRTTLGLVLIEEPRSLEDGKLVPVAKLAFRWPDGPRDCEAVTVDSENGDILLLSKKRVPAQLFRLPLAALFERKTGDTEVAQEIAHVRGLPQPTAQELADAPHVGRFRAQISGMALRDDGLLAIQTYRDTYVYRRQRNRSWKEALRGPPQPLRIIPVPQPEAIAFDPHSGDIFIASERIPSPLLRVRSVAAPAPK